MTRWCGISVGVVAAVHLCAENGQEKGLLFVALTEASKQETANGLCGTANAV